MAEQDEHTAKMQRLKASVDRRIEAAQDEKGLLIVYTGAGKGKTTAALGMALRCLGHGMKVAIVQWRRRIGSGIRAMRKRPGRRLASSCVIRLMRW